MTYSPAQIAVAKESWLFWISTGCDAMHAAALLGDEDGETSFRIGAVGDKGTAYGPFQHHAARCNAIAAGCGIDMRTASHADQLKGAHWEMTEGTYRRVWPAFMTTVTLWSGVAILVTKYEQSAEQGRDVKRRVALAEYWLATFGKDAG